MNVPYELVMILGMVASAWMQHKFPEKAWVLALVGACLGMAGALCLETIAFSLGPLFLRLGLACVFVHALCRAGMLINQSRGYLPFTSCALVSYAFLAVAQHFQITARYFSTASAICTGLAALFLVVSRKGAPRPDEPSHARKAERLLGDQPPKATLALLAALLIAVQLFNSLDMYIFCQFSQARGEGYEHVFPICLLLIGISYFFWGGVARKRGVPVLFVISCALSQFFLLIMLTGADSVWIRLVPPLYVLSSSGIDLCVILFPMAFRTLPASPLPPLTVGVILFRALKLYLIPSLFPERWAWTAGIHQVFGLAVLAALGQMLAVICLVAIRKDSQIARLKQMLARRNRPPTPPLPSTLTSREKEVFQLLLAGKNRGEIAEHMGISFSTVNKHCVSIYRKTECSSHLELLSKYGYFAAKKYSTA